jgi:hypothetical protein
MSPPASVPTDHPNVTAIIATMESNTTVKIEKSGPLKTWFAEASFGF